jgi:hypothetical protein
MDLRYYRDSIRHHGLGSTLYHAAYRAANHVTDVVVWDALVITLDMVDDRYLLDQRRAQGRFVDAETMREYVDDPANMLTDAFINEAAANGDRCYALFEGEALMSYGWYSTRPTRLMEVPGEPILHFDSSYAYMYNGYTRPEYRGLRLHAVGMAAALEECTRERLRGILAYVVSSNVASLKSCYRMGYQCFGHIVMINVGGRSVWRSTPGCRKYGFHVEAAAS